MARVAHLVRFVVTLGVAGVLGGFEARCGGVYQNDRYSTAVGFRIVFSEPVTITSASPVFPVRYPASGTAIEFTFTGGSVPRGGQFWLNWSPASATVVRYEWLLHLYQTPTATTGHTDRITCVAFSPNGSLLATGSDDQSIRLWDVESRQLVRVLRGHTKAVNCLAFSPDGRLLASGGRDMRVILWGVDTGQQVGTFSGHRDWVRGVAFSPDGRLVASGSDDETVALWEVATGKLVRYLRASNWVLSVAFSPDGQWIAAVTWDGKVPLWDIRSGDPNPTAVITTGGTVRYADYSGVVAFSPDGELLATGQWDGRITLWSVRTKEKVRILEGHTQKVTGVTFFTGGKTLASVSSDRTLRLWDVLAGKEVWQKRVEESSLFTVAVSPDDRFISYGSHLRTPQILNAPPASALVFNKAPAAQFAFERVRGRDLKVPGDARQGDRLRFDGSASQDPDGQVVSYEWDWESDGVFDLATSETVVERVFETAGNFAVTLRVTDDKGASTTVTRTIVVAKRLPPRAQFSLSPRPATLLDRVSFTDESTDPDGELVSWLWEFGDGESSTERSPQHQYRSRGRFTVTLTVVDDERFESKATAVVEVLNVVPVAAFDWEAPGSKGASVKEPRCGERVVFNASASQDPDGKIVAYEWDWDGDGMPDARTTSPTVEHTFTRGGTWSVVLRVIDDAGETNTARASVAVSDLWAPLADFVASPPRASLLDEVEFRDQSLDPDGRIVSWRWDFGDGASSTERSPRHRFTGKGRFRVTLTVTDDDGLTGEKVAEVEVVNLRPTAEFRASRGPLYTGVPVRFDASESVDPDGRILWYEWDWDGDGRVDVVSEKPVVEQVFGRPGEWHVVLRVIDDNGDAARTFRVCILIERTPPKASFAVDPLNPTLFDAVQFTDASTDADGVVVGWEWDFGDGAKSTDRNPTHTFSRKGKHLVRLVVTDNDGMTGEATHAVNVVNIPPVARIAVSPVTPYVGQSVVMDGSKSLDPDGAIVSYRWDIDGDGRPDREGRTVALTFGTPGRRTVRLLVEDEDGATAWEVWELEVAAIPRPVTARAVYGLVVGISDYKEIVDLTYGRSDAEAFHRWLLTTARVPTENVRLLTDDEATLINVLEGLEWLRRRAGKDDLVVFYFAGHGYQGTDFPPLDEEDGLDEYFVLYDTRKASIEVTALRDDEFGVLLDRIESEHVLVVFDSCHAGGGSRGERGLPRGARPVGDRADIWGDFKLEGQLVLAAGTEDQLSWEDARLGGGVFTHFLLQGMKGEADFDGDYRITVQELYGYVSAEVSRYVREFKGATQQPQIVGRGNPGVVVALTNQPPVAEFSVRPINPVAWFEAMFCDTSKDDVGVVRRRWSFGDGSTSVAECAVHVFERGGTFVVRLEVEDGDGLTSAAEQQITVGPPGEVTAVDAARGLVIISLGSRHGLAVGQRLEIVHVIRLPDGTLLHEVRALVEVIHLSSPERSVCRVLQQNFPAEVKDIVRPARSQ